MGPSSGQRSWPRVLAPGFWSLGPQELGFEVLVSSVWLCSPLATWERDERSGRRAQSPKSSRTEALRQLAGGSQKLLVSEKWGLRPRPLEMARSLCQSTSALGGGEDAQLRLTTPTPLLHWLGALSPASLAWEQGAFLS